MSFKKKSTNPADKTSSNLSPSSLKMPDLVTSTGARISKKWGFHYNPLFPEHEIYTEILKNVVPKGTVVDNIIVGALINRSTSHIFIHLRFQVHRIPLTGLAFIIPSSIEAVSSQSSDFKTSQNFPGYEVWTGEVEEKKAINWPELKLCQSGIIDQKVFKEFFSTLKKIKSPSYHHPLDDERKTQKTPFTSTDPSIIFDIANGRSLKEIVWEKFNDENATISSLVYLKALKHYYQEFESFCVSKLQQLQQQQNNIKTEEQINIKTEDQSNIKTEPDDLESI